MTEYSNLIDWDDEQVWAVLFPYLNKYGKAKKNRHIQVVDEPHIRQPVKKGYRKVY